MIDLETIEREINELEARGDTTYSICERLSWLYTVRDHLRPAKRDALTTESPGGTDFLDACDGVPFPQLMRVLDEHMSAIRVVYPLEYDNVMAKIRGL